MVQTLTAFAVGVLVFLGVYLLVKRGREAAKRRRSPFKSDRRLRTENDRLIEKLLKEDATQPPSKERLGICFSRPLTRAKA
jgi:hypothetical protein